MQREQIEKVKQRPGETVTIAGFVHAVRDQGSIKFILVRDATGLIQVVLLKNHAEAFEKAKELNLESVIAVTGLAKEQKQAPGGYEIEAESIVVLSKAEPELPIPVVTEKFGDETEQTKRYDWRQIDLRRPEKQFIFKIWTELERGFRNYWEKQNYVQIYTPSFMVTPSESGAEVFEVKYFDKKAYLAQSPQFYKQAAMASGLEKVFVVGPVYRAEPSYTTRHMTEFTGWDFEISYIDSHYDVMTEEEKLIVEGFTRVKEKLMPDLEIPTIPFPKITFKEAKEKLKGAGLGGEKSMDLSSEEEKELGKIIKNETGHDFVFITDWPYQGRAFYHMRLEEDKSLTKGFDLLYKGLEITTGAQREHRYDVLKAQALERGMDPASLEDYLNFFKYGCPPHGGAGIGPGRIIMKLLDLPNVKEATFLPRDVKRLRP